jgi:Uma2 family endonuclease
MPLATESDIRFTYAEYVTWPDVERWEIVDGRAYDMTPSPSIRHQRTVGQIFFVMEQALQGHRCTPCVARADVISSDHDVVQRGVFVVCDPGKIAPEGFRGAPDVVFEVLCASTAFKDRGVKRELYERHGVQEYVLVDPEARYMERWCLGDDGHYGRSEVVGHREALSLPDLGGVGLALAEVSELPEEDPKERLPPPTRRT